MVATSNMHHKNSYHSVQIYTDHSCNIYSATYFWLYAKALVVSICNNSWLAGSNHAVSYVFSSIIIVTDMDLGGYELQHCCIIRRGFPYAIQNIVSQLEALPLGAIDLCTDIGLSS